jgi:UDP-GlcNAc:undecaprenyl-phosphate/decaprenyl-phosphate GlcNAc-1-phosphate transferase
MKPERLKYVAALSAGLLLALAGFTITVAPSLADDTKGAGGTPALTTQKDRFSYSLGVETVKNYKRLRMDIDLDLLIRGMKEADAGGKLRMSDADIKSALIEYRGQVLAKQRGEKVIAGQDNKEEGEKFLATNKIKEGVITLPSGLQYKILKAGDGKKPTDDDTVQCNLRGTLINGTEFQDTYAASQPITFKVNDFHIIKGVRDAVKLMPVGSKWQIFIPPQLAYMVYGRAPVIGPYATLIFELELLAIK